MYRTKVTLHRVTPYWQPIVPVKMISPQRNWPNVGQYSCNIVCPLDKGKTFKGARLEQANECREESPSIWGTLFRDWVEETHQRSYNILGSVKWKKRSNNQLARFLVWLIRIMQGCVMASVAPGTFTLKGHFIHKNIIKNYNLWQGWNKDKILVDPLLFGYYTWSLLLYSIFFFRFWNEIKTILRGHLGGSVG